MTINKQLLKIVQIEYLRLRESAGKLSTDREAVEAKLIADEASAEDKIYRRAEQLLSAADKHALTQPLSDYRRLAAIILAIAAFLGATASLEIFSLPQQASANFFWILFALLGVNAISLLLWLLFTLCLPNMPSGNSFLTTIQNQLSRIIGRDQLALQAWQSSLITGRQQRWHMAVFSHSLWLVFLLGSFVCIGLLLATRQYDFVWESTILSDHTFIAISQGVAALPNSLGIAVPTADDVLASRLGSQTPAPELRLLWSNLLFSALFLYGLLPRVLCLAVSLIQRHRCWTALSIDFTLPYYYKLKLLLSPAAQAQGVVDSDDATGSDINGHAADTGNANNANNSNQLTEHTIPANALLVGLEWAQDWPPAVNAPMLQDLRLQAIGSNAQDRDSRRAVIEELSNSQSPVLLLARFDAAPDRGTANYLAQLRQCKQDIQLLLGHETGTTPDDARLREWLAVAKKSGLAPTQVHIREN